MTTFPNSSSNSASNSAKSTNSGNSINAPMTLIRESQKNQRVGIFIDTQNLYHSARSNFRANVNYRALIEGAVHGRRLIRAFAYVIRSEAGDETKFFDALADIGIEMRVKDLQIFYSGEKKADWDVGIAIDIVRMTEKLDAVVLVSGDGDFLEVLRYVKSRGVRAEVMAFRKTTSAKLMEEVDEFYDLGAEAGKFLIPLGKPSFAKPLPKSPSNKPLQPHKLLRPFRQLIAGKTSIKK